MKSIATVNTQLPTIDNVILYRSGQSLIDYDIIVFDPKLPYSSRVNFGAGGSCIDIDASRSLLEAITHWSSEIKIGLEAGKTIFFLLNKLEIDQLATGSTSPRKGQTTYSTASFNNYHVLPFKLEVRNAAGTRCKTNDSRFKILFSNIEKSIEYQVLLKSTITESVFTTKDQKFSLGGVLKIEGMPGHLVLLPFFNIPRSTEVVDGDECWTDEALKDSHALVQSFVEVDKSLRSDSAKTPMPGWISSQKMPNVILEINDRISAIDAKISKLEKKKAQEVEDKKEVLRFQALLYENGASLEVAVAESLKLLGYEVENYQEGDLEIDHIIISPSGDRWIGETEGKDDSAIGISKFRQLETNINEDFDRDVISEPARGILFGNGYRLTPPASRKNQFTEKCLTNAQRLGTTLITTTDLYSAVVSVLNSPNDEEIKSAIRQAIESTRGAVVQFPQAPEE